MLAGMGAAVAVASGVLGTVAEASAATPSSRTVYNMNPFWRFAQRDVANAQAVSFDDSTWTKVSVPHTYNDVDSFDNHITSSGESAVAMQITWYRKRFTLPAEQAGSKVLIEFEGVRQATTVFVNGVQVGLYEYGVTPFGLDITAQVRFGTENVIAVKADNTKWRPEQATNTSFQWDSRDFNPTYGGLTRSVRLYVLPRTYFTLPLYTNLRTTGTYVYASNFDIAGRSATVTAEAQVRNEHGDPRTVTVSANVIDQFLGGFNPNKPGSVHKPYVDTEAGINRVFLRASRTAGEMTLRATCSGLTAATATVTSSPITLPGGLTTRMPAGY
ncbi:hypothetical protein A6A25_26735 [Saccharothrix sp. CB00851]|nr:hypothetical protein A6A25_26735 [Saccharothrix sp. CB00851]